MPKEANKTEYATKGDLEDLRCGLRKEINEDIGVHMGVLYEKFENEVKVIAEQHVDIDRNLVNINQHLGHVDQRLDKLEIKTDMLIETVGEIKVDVTDIKDGLKNKTDIKDHKLLEKRVSVLEATA